MITRDKNFYDNHFYAETVFELGCVVDDLSKWSVYNDDKLNEEIDLLKKAYRLIREAKPYEDQKPV